jgi:enoyl-CoA hydratase/carnithine racemase
MRESYDLGRVTVDVSDGVARVRMNRPQARNAIDMQMCEQIRSVFEEINADDDVRAVLLSASGSSFCAGADLKERADKDAAWVRRRRAAAYAAYSSIQHCRCPVVVLLHGAVVGSGGEIALAADFAIAAADATFWYPETRWGTIGATQRLQRAVGARKAKELLFTNARIDAQEALRLGLVVRVVGSDQLAAAGEEIATGIAAAPRLAMTLTKRAVDLGGEADLERGIRIEMYAVEQCLDGSDWREGVSRFARQLGGDQQ